MGVWVSAESVKHSVGIFQAHEKKIELSQMSNDPNEDLDTFVNKMIDASLSHPKNVDMRGKPVPEGLWRDLDIRYDWHFSIQGISPDLVWVKSFNGNNDWFDFSGKRKHHTSRRDERAHLPETIDIHWTDASKNKYWAQAEMDLEETKAAFETLSKESPQEKMELVLHEKGALLKTKSRTITLSKFKRNTWKN